MPITVYCPNPPCNTRLTVGDERAGGSFACPKCNAVVRVPASPAMPKWEVVEEPQPVTAPLRSPADPQHNATAPPDPFEPQPEPFTKPDSIKDAAHWTLVPFAVVGALLSTAGVVYFLRDSPIIGVVLLVAGLLTIVGAITYVQCQIQDVCEWCGEWQAVERTGVPHE